MSAIVWLFALHLVPIIRGLQSGSEVQTEKITANEVSGKAHAGSPEFQSEPQMPQLTQILQGLTLAAVIKGFCVAGNVMVHVSPFPQAKSWGTIGHTGEVDAAPFITIAFNGSQWSYYGLLAWYITQRSGFLVLVQSNIIGSVLGIYYTLMFYRYCRNEAAFQQLKLYISGVATLILLEGSALAILPKENALFLTGLISSFCGFIGALSMLVTLPIVIKHRDGNSIPGAYVLANFASGLCWCACGWLLNDPLVMAPNILCVIAASLCLYLKIIYISDVSDSEAIHDVPKKLRPSSGYGTNKSKAGSKAEVFTGDTGSTL